ncbi:hypothetical protein E4U26_002383 [Claviceps purpurea]|nr:hypothetical protein E4U26_002383 [Claviceps purpurea]
MQACRSSCGKASGPPNSSMREVVPCSPRAVSVDLWHHKGTASLLQLDISAAFDTVHHGRLGGPEALLQEERHAYIARTGSQTKYQSPPECHKAPPYRQCCF